MHSDSKVKQKLPGAVVCSGAVLLKTSMYIVCTQITQVAGGAEVHAISFRTMFC